MMLAVVVAAACSWAPVPVPISTRWAKDVHPELAPEYPRPHLARVNSSSWQHLNGLWQVDYRSFKSLDQPPFGRILPDEILVPYPIESSLSGLRQQPAFGYLWYRRALPAGFDGSSGRVLLHFGAVDWEAVVYVGGENVGRHTGGYTSFTFDITAQYQPGAELLVGVYDPSDCVRQEHKDGAGQPGQDGPNPCPANLMQPDQPGQQPIGKQAWGIFGNKTGTAAGNSQGIKYTPSSGIWQTVWLERVPTSCYLADAHIRTAIDGAGSGSLAVTPSLVGAGCAAAEFAAVIYNRSTGAVIVPRTVASAGSAQLTVGLPQHSLHLWSPSSPTLYGVRLTVGDDTVEAYAGVREIKVLRSQSDGLPRTHLNGAPFYQAGVLGQGFFPESLYAAPTDAALEDDILKLKLLGFNMVRKHILREPDRWYYYADVHGIVVWQDMPSSFNLSGAVAQAQFTQELRSLVTSVRSFIHVGSRRSWTCATARPTRQGRSEARAASATSKISMAAALAARSTLTLTVPPHLLPSRQDSERVALFRSKRHLGLPEKHHIIRSAIRVNFCVVF
jgi:beta-galactosidase/beta-glucuronidase